MKYKNIDVYWDGLTGSVLLLGEENDALDFLREFNSGKFDPSCCPAFSEEEALKKKRWKFMKKRALMG